MAAEWAHAVGFCLSKQIRRGLTLNMTMGEVIHPNQDFFARRGCCSRYETCIHLQQVYLGCEKWSVGTSDSTIPLENKQPIGEQLLSGPKERIEEYLTEQLRYSL